MLVAGGEVILAFNINPFISTKYRELCIFLMIFIFIFSEGFRYNIGGGR